MRSVIIGYPGSQKIVKASKYLVAKYLPMFEPIYLNYKGPIDGWAEYLVGFLRYFQDEHIVFALDDYLISGDVDEAVFSAAIDALNHTNVVAAKLCYSTSEENEEYPVTTQYTIWDTRSLMEILSQVRNPWEFEIAGSARHKRTQAEIVFKPCIPYFTNSALSGRWEGVRLDGLKEEDIKYLKDHGLI